MINFTVGPVQSEDYILSIGAEQVPYFRTPEFSAVMLESEKLMLELVNAPEGARAVFLTGSGTASMEASLINILTPGDKSIVVNGGSFGERFVQICSIHGLDYEEIKLGAGKDLTEEHLKKFEGRKEFTSFIVNLHETSTGVLYNLQLISSFCKRNNLLLIVDAISAFLADEIDMKKSGIDALITGSQKALACPPGVSIIALSPRALKRVESNNPRCMYLDLKSALTNGERGQTPFTPAVGTLRQINARLKYLKDHGGADGERERISALARYFRKNIEGLPLEILPRSMSNAVTSLRPLNVSAYDVFTRLKDEYGIWVCPNGGELRDRIFRVGHIGYLTTADYDKLISALKKMNREGLL